VPGSGSADYKRGAGNPGEILYSVLLSAWLAYGGAALRVEAVKGRQSGLKRCAGIGGYVNRVALFRGNKK